MGVTFYTSLNDAMRDARATGERLVTMSLSINTGRSTLVVYRRTFDITEEATEEQTPEIAVFTALLRKYGKKKGRGIRPYELRFHIVRAPVATYMSPQLVQWLGNLSVPRETVPAPVVETMKTGLEETVKQECLDRVKLEALNVTEVRKTAAKLGVPGAWRRRKAELIDAILASGQESAVAS